MRLFIALPLGAFVEKQLGKTISELKRHDNHDGVKWAVSTNIHLTLKFLGETDRRLVEPIKRSMSDNVREFKPVKMQINRLGCFPSLRRPRVIWLGAQEAIDSLTEMAKSIDAGMHELGFELENKPFRAHLTLGRVRRNAEISKVADALVDYKFPPLEAELARVVLYQSTLTPRGPIYDRLFESVLGEERFDD
ncbi:MAG: RNA 2',3'-cyclic phosphodiesterase [bacterium]|nr:RNA 2',3'-cyclic phosphodiesterase [bacterium]